MGNVKIRPRKARIFQRSVSEGPSAADSNTATVIPASGAYYSNEPVGMTLVSRAICDVLPPTSSSEPAGWSNNWFSTGNDNLGIVNDPTAPINGPNVLRIRYPGPGENPDYPDGFPAGIGPCNVSTSWSTAGSHPEDIGECSELFIGYTFKVVGDGTDFQNHASGTKFGFFSGPNKSGAQNEFFFLMKGGAGQVTSMQIGLNKQGDSAWLDVSTESGSSISAGAGASWHKLEMHAITNSIGPDLADGVLKIWIDDALVLNETTEKWRSTTWPRKFLDYKMAPTFGGVGGPNKAQNDDIYMADIYISGKI